MATKILPSFFPVLFVFLVGCGGRQPVNPFFSTSMVGQTWNFRDGFGNEMHITVEPGPRSNLLPSGCTVWHYTKSAPLPGTPDGYWSPGNPGAELWFPLCPEPDGSWTAREIIAHFPAGCPWAGCDGQDVTLDIGKPKGKPAPYLIVPRPENYTVVTEYLAFGKADVLTFDSVEQGISPNAVSWQTTAVLDNGNLISHQWENCSSLAFPHALSCAEEIWTFEPDRGLTRVEVVDAGNGVPADPRYTMVRVN